MSTNNHNSQQRNKRPASRQASRGGSKRAAHKSDKSVDPKLPLIDRSLVYSTLDISSIDPRILKPENHSTNYNENVERIKGFVGFAVTESTRLEAQQEFPSVPVSSAAAETLYAKIRYKDGQAQVRFEAEDELGGGTKIYVNRPAKIRTVQERYINKHQELNEKHAGDLYSLQRQTQRRRKPCSAAKRKELNLWKIPQDKLKYELYVPLNRLWTDYMSNLFSPSCSNEIIMEALLKSDFHGCIITVEQSKCPSYVGLTGIILQETENTFKIITKENELKTIPKKKNIFSFELMNKKFNLYGDHFCFRSYERAARKFKPKPSIDL